MGQKQCVDPNCGEWLPADAKFCSKCQKRQNGPASWKPAIVVGSVIGVVGLGLALLLRSQLSHRGEDAATGASSSASRVTTGTAARTATGSRKETPVVVHDSMAMSGPVGLAVRPLVSRNPDRWGPRLRIIEHEGKCYLEAQAGAEFGLEFEAFDDLPHLFVASIDGTSIMTGKPASASDLGYVVMPEHSAPSKVGSSGSATVIPGWRDGAAQVHRFVFSERAMAYASLSGRPANIGVIGLVAYRPGQNRSASPPPSAGGAPASDLGTAFGESATDTSRTGRVNSGEEVARFALFYASTDLLRQAGIPVDVTKPLGETDPFPADSPVPSVPPPSAASLNRDLYVPANPIAGSARFTLRASLGTVGGDLDSLKAAENRDGLWYLDFGTQESSDWYPLALFSKDLGSQREFQDLVSQGQLRKVAPASVDGSRRGAPAKSAAVNLPNIMQDRELFIAAGGVVGRLWRDRNGQLLPFVYLRGIERRGQDWFLDFGNPDANEGKSFDVANCEWYPLASFSEQTGNEIKALISSGRYQKPDFDPFER